MRIFLDSLVTIKKINQNIKLDIIWGNEIKESKTIITRYKAHKTNVELILYLNKTLDEI